MECTCKGWTVLVNVRPSKLTRNEVPATVPRVAVKYVVTASNSFEFLRQARHSQASPVGVPPDLVHIDQSE